MNDDKRIIDIICDSLLPLAFLILVIICIILCFSLPVHAASDQYYFPMEQNKNLHFSGATSAIDNYFDSSNNYIFVSYVTSNWGAATDSFVICYYPKSLGISLYGEIYNNAREFGLYKTTQSDFSFASFDVYWQNGNIPIVQTVRTITPENFFNRIFVSSSYSSDADYVSNYQIYTSNNVGSRQIVLLYSSSENEDINDNNTIPDDFSKPDINDYVSNWSNSPSFDNSSVEAALSSVFDNITWFANNLNNSLSGFFSYLADSFNWGLQMVINNIRNKISEMVHAIGDKIDEVQVGIGSIIDNIEDFVDYIKEPVDKQAIEVALEGTTLYSVSSIGSTIKNTFTDYFDSIPQPDTLVFSVPYTILTKSGNIVVDFSWYADIRSTVLPWIVGFLYAGFALSIFRSIPSIIHGVSGVLQKGG